MSKIYRLHSGATDAVQDWTQIDNYLDTVQINNIRDAAGANAKSQITSIPSPFARIDLVKTAFKQVTAGGEPEGISIFHKMVSDTLDVGQVFFNSARLAGRVEIMAWNPGLRWIGGQMVVDEHSDLATLMQGSANHKLYGETLKMFFSQDAAEYNFDRLQQVYLLHYKDGPGRLNIIGGTSPATLFFSSANKLDYVNLKFKNDKLFDDTYCALPERSEDYILFLYALREAMPEFKTRFKVIDDYLELCLSKLPAQTRDKVIALNSGSYERQYNSIMMAGTGNHPEIAGYELRCVKVNQEQPQEVSDFVIAATQPVQGLRPLVLPAYTFNGKLNYVDGPWPAQLKAPFADPLPLAERMLPGQEIKYPYLTTSDLLEPYLIQLPFEPNGDKFFDGYFPKGSHEGYLLPLTQAFFTYFQVTDLQKPLPDGRRMFELEKLAGNGVKARLRIPVKNGKVIDIERTYLPDKAQGHGEPDPAKNQGLIRSQQFSVVIYPFVKRGTDAHAAYTVMLLTRDTAHGPQYPYALKYYKDTAPQQELKPKTQRQKSHKQQDSIDTVYDVLHVEFDWITVTCGNARGCLVPLFPLMRSSNRQFAFSIDFGTTNTHIEYSVDGGRPQPLEITAADQQVGMLHCWNDETYDHLASAKFGIGATCLLENVPKELMPELIGGKARHKFPHRTVVSEPLQIDLNSETYPLADFSIYWQHEDGELARQLRFHTNLKWSNLGDRQATERRVGGYLANLILLIRNKVVLNGGDPAKTKIVWFYPTSMSKARFHTFESIWLKQIGQYLGPDIQVTCLPESIAPFYYFRHEDGVKAGDKPVINIDIGGGTTDVVVYKNDSITSYTSFKFAGNALFGDGYSNPSKVNGFVQFFERQYRTTLQQTRLGKYLPSAGSMQKSDDFITTLFGLQDHPGRGEQYFSFTEEIRATEELKIVPLLFISSIFYHVAQYQKAQGSEIPRFITFSGTASKMLRILDAGKGLKSITHLANLVFNEVFGGADAGIELKMADGPKEVTAKGGLYNPVVPVASKFVLFGTENELGNKQLTYKDALDEKTQKAVVKEVQSFIDRFFTWDSKMDFADEFGINTKRFAEFKKVIKADLDIYLVEGIYELKEEMSQQEDNDMKETLFFMPLKGALNKLAFYIIDVTP